MSKSASRIWQKSMERPLAGSTNQAAGRRCEVGGVLQPQLCISKQHLHLWISLPAASGCHALFRRTRVLGSGLICFIPAAGPSVTITFGVGTPERIAAEGKIGPGGTAEVWVFRESLVFRVEGKKSDPTSENPGLALTAPLRRQSSHDLRRGTTRSP